jgi:hypothetical protein
MPWSPDPSSRFVEKLMIAQAIGKGTELPR